MLYPALLTEESLKMPKVYVPLLDYVCEPGLTMRRKDGRWENTLTNLIILTSQRIFLSLPKLLSWRIPGIYTSASIAPQESTEPRPITFDTTKQTKQKTREKKQKLTRSNKRIQEKRTKQIVCMR